MQYARALHSRRVPGILLQSSSRRFSSGRTRDTDRYWEPDKIIPSGFGEVRVISNTIRDAQQSNLSAEMADVHRQQVAKIINPVYQPIDGAPGYEQTWGGTVPMFDIWKRGVDPFDELRQMSKHLMDTPQSALIRSNGLCAMGNQPKEVVDAFISHAYDAGVDVFTNFCAHNDWRNHANVAEAVHKKGGHYQGALSWAVHHEDPTIYNVQWAVDLMGEFKKMGAHSLYVKDPSGVLTPEMAGVLAAQIKDKFPDTPLVFHTHYQTGFGYMTYYEAVKNGANGVECSLGFSDGAGQPYTLTMLRAFEELGFDTGNPDKDAMGAIATMCNKELRPLYYQANVVRTPDINVEKTGIAGGQRSILDKELIDAGQPHLIPKVDTEVQVVRDQGGKVCQVTPVADSYAREAMRRLRGGDSNSNFAPGYASILVGEGGLVKEPVNAAQQAQALWERSCKHLQALVNSGDVSEESAASLQADDSKLLRSLRATLDKLSFPVVTRARLAEVKARISQLDVISSNESLSSSLNRKIARASATVDGNLISCLDDRVALLQKELAALTDALDNAADVSDADYEQILKANPNSTIRAQLEEAVLGASLSSDAVAKLASGCALVTIVQADLSPPVLASSRQAVLELNEKHNLNLTSDTPEMKRRLVEWTTLHAMYSKAAIPGLIQNFFTNYERNQAFWPPTFGEAATTTSAAVVTGGGAPEATATPETATLATLAFLLDERAEAEHSFDVFDPWSQTSSFRMNSKSERTVELYFSDSSAQIQQVKVGVVHNADESFELAVPKDLDDPESPCTTISVSGSLDDASEIMTATVDGKKIKVAITDGPHPGSFTIRPAGAKEQTTFLLDSGAATGSSGAGSSGIAPINGAVWKVLAKPGDEVKQGQVLLILEAMKMEHAVKAPRDGVVAEVLCKEGDFVNGGQLLASLEQVEE